MLPFAGLLIGACGALPLVLGTQAGLPASLAAILATAAGLLVTGGLHEDGLADTADGLGGGATRERKLAIMRDSRIGTFGVLAVGMALAWRVAAVTALLAQASAIAVALVMLAGAALSRAVCLLPMALLAPARPDGLGRGMGALPRRAFALCLSLGMAAGLGLPWLAGFGLGRAGLGCLLSALGAGLVTGLAQRQIGGHTGDIAGACQQIAEAAFLLGLLLWPAHG